MSKVGVIKAQIKQQIIDEIDNCFTDDNAYLSDNLILLKIRVAVVTLLRRLQQRMLEEVR